MSLVAPQSPELSAPRRPVQERAVLKRIGSEWSLGDWSIALCSVGLAVSSASFFSWSYAVSLQAPDYFQQAALARMPPKLDLIETGSVGEAAHADAIPAPAIVRDREPLPGDYQIVMIFQGEALLATREELVRVKVGSVVPGLGTVKAIEGTSLGGSITADKATLRSANTPDP